MCWWPAADGKPARDFTGKLPFAWPGDARAPLVNPLFPVGYGLDYAQRTVLELVNEDPRVNLSTTDGLTRYLVRGKVPAPWRLVIDGSIGTRAVDIAAQEDAREFAWNARGVLSIEGAAVNLDSYATGDFGLALDWRIDRPVAGPILLSFGGQSLDLQRTVRAMKPGSATQTLIPLRCFAHHNASFASVGAPFRLTAAAGFVTTLRSVRLEPASRSLPCPK